MEWQESPKNGSDDESIGDASTEPGDPPVPATGEADLRDLDVQSCTHRA